MLRLWLLHWCRSLCGRLGHTFRGVSALLDLLEVLCILCNMLEEAFFKFTQVLSELCLALFLQGIIFLVWLLQFSLLLGLLKSN